MTLVQRQSGTQRTALVTGGAVRLGRFLALGLAEAGYDIALHFNRSEAEARSAQQAIEALGRRCLLLPADLNRPEQVAELVQRAARGLGPVDLLLNSASAYAAGQVLDTDWNGLQELFAVNLFAPFQLIRQFALHRRSQPAGIGNVINILDNKIAFNQHQYAGHLLSKAGLAELTKLAALELAPQIRVNGIAPGIVMPSPARSPEYLAWRLERVPTGAAGSGQDILQALRYLSEAPFVTGQILFVDGGESISDPGRNTANFEPRRSPTIGTPSQP
jgi:NAD(P)-dependent dehydrogenase (short-subunit alcohol dehydrogenase family)